MRLQGRWAPFVACAATLGIAGCGTSAPVSKPTASITITAPTSGATVGEHRVVVTGVVTPANAQVLVSGQPAKVAHGSFQRELWITAPTQTVTVTAQASGYVAGRAATTINFSPSVAAAIASSVSLTQGPTIPQSLVSAKTLHNTFALAPAPAPKPAKKSSKSPSKSPSKPSGGSTSTPAPAPSPAPVSNPSPPPTPTPVLTRVEIRKTWESTCLKHTKSQNVVPYCTCLYTQLEGTHRFDSTSDVNALVKRLNRFIRNGDFAALPKVVQRALTVCAPKLPPLGSMGSKPTLTKLNGLSHPRAPAEPLPVIKKPRSGR